MTCQAALPKALRLPAISVSRKRKPVTCSMLNVSEIRPAMGKSGRKYANSSIRITAQTKLGAETPSRATMRMELSTQVPRKRADAMPSGSPIAIIIALATKISSRVAGRNWPMSTTTGRLV